MFQFTYPNNYNFNCSIELQYNTIDLVSYYNYYCNIILFYYYIIKDFFFSNFNIIIISLSISIFTYFLLKFIENNLSKNNHNKTTKYFDNKHKFLCKYHSNRNTHFPPNEKQCMALKNNNKRCNQIC